MILIGINVENLPKLAIVWLRLRGLTLEQFLEVMHKGTDFKNRHPQISPLLQIMPWPVFGNMSDRELQAVYEFLRAIPCVGSSERCGS